MYYYSGFLIFTLLSVFYVCTDVCLYGQHKVLKFQVKFHRKSSWGLEYYSKIGLLFICTPTRPPSLSLYWILWIERGKNWSRSRCFLVGLIHPLSLSVEICLVCVCIMCMYVHMDGWMFYYKGEFTTDENETCTYTLTYIHILVRRGRSSSNSRKGVTQRKKTINWTSHLCRHMDDVKPVFKSVVV